MRRNPARPAALLEDETGNAVCVVDDQFGDPRLQLNPAAVIETAAQKSGD